MMGEKTAEHAEINFTEGRKDNEGRGSEPFPFPGLWGESQAFRAESGI
jgi:hypothetical protein